MTAEADIYGVRVPLWGLRDEPRGSSLCIEILPGEELHMCETCGNTALVERYNGERVFVDVDELMPIKEAARK